MKKIQSRNALLTLLVVGFVSLFAVGCGDSENFVFTGNKTPITGDTGNLVFRFTQAQTVDTVPPGTASLRFDFFSSDSRSLATFLFTETRPYAELIIIGHVPAETKSVVVTAFGANGQPLALLTGDVTVVVGTDQTVDLVFNSSPSFTGLTLAPSPAIILSPGSDTRQVQVNATFDTAQVLGQQTNYTISLDPTTVGFTFTENGGEGTTANITPGGLVQAVSYQQNSTLNASFTAFGSPRSASTLVRTVEMEGEVVDAFDEEPYVPGESFNGWYSVFFHDSDGVTALPVNSTANTTYTLASNQTTVEVNQQTGTFTTTEATTGDIIIRCTWADPRSQAANGSGGTKTSFSIDFTFEQATQ